MVLVINDRGQISAFRVTPLARAAPPQEDGAGNARAEAGGSK